MSEQHECDLKKYFQQADTSGDGCLTIQELTKILRDLGCKLSDPEIATCFCNDDTNKDNKISLDEFLASNRKRDPKDVKEEELYSVFKQLDKDGSGYIDQGDLEKCLGGRMEADEIKAMLSEVDKNSDGKVGRDEFITMWKSKLN